jgi:hypothetical protein
MNRGKHGKPQEHPEPQLAQIEQKYDSNPGRFYRKDDDRSRSAQRRVLASSASRGLIL